MGAYIVSAPAIFAALAHLAPAHDGKYQLTDCVHELIRSGLRVESYQICDPDEIQGINTRQDLEQAEFILQKRLFRPRREEEQHQVAFGTGGWRAVIGEGFTLHNVRRLSQALANEITRRGEEKRGVLIGYDRRFLSNRAGDAAAEVFAGNNIPVTLLTEDAPTPLITYATAVQNAAYGLAFTASHNPPEWNGLKVFHGDGSLLLDDETVQIQNETNRLALEEVIKIDLDIALESGVVKRRDFTNQYVDAVEALIDLDAIRGAGLKVIVDPMYGVGQLTLGTILTEARCRVTFIHDRHNPLFGGRSPAPNLDALRLLATHVVEDHYDLGPGHRRRRRPHRHRGRAREVHHHQRHPAAGVLVYARSARRAGRRGAQSGHDASAGPAGGALRRAVLSRCRWASSTLPARWSPTRPCWAASPAAG